RDEGAARAGPEGGAGDLGQGPGERQRPGHHRRAAAHPRARPAGQQDDEVNTLNGRLACSTKDKSGRSAPREWGARLACWRNIRSVRGSSRQTQRTPPARACPPMDRPRPRAPGFTLIELLVGQAFQPDSSSAARQAAKPDVRAKKSQAGKPDVRPGFTLIEL